MANKRQPNSAQTKQVTREPYRLCVEITESQRDWLSANGFASLVQDVDEMYAAGDTRTGAKTLLDKVNAALSQMPDQEGGQGQTQVANKKPDIDTPC